MTDSFETGLIRILDHQGHTVGTGFIVSNELAVTCAHVVQAAKAQPSDTLSFVIHANQQVVQAVVAAEYWRPPNSEDVAFIRFKFDLPKDISPIPLGVHGQFPASLKTFGFPKAKPIEGMHAKCEILGSTTENGNPVWQLRSSEISSGYSGAPLWDEELGVALGMVVSITVPDSYGRLSQTAFAIPTETLQAICPLLAPNSKCPYRGLAVFEEEHVDIYFGRDRVAADLLSQLADRDFVTLVGVSGSGKSSLVRAGIAKALRSRPQPDLSARSRVICVPGPSPVLNLVLAMVTKIGQESVVNAINASPSIIHDRSVQESFVANWMIQPVDMFAQVIKELANEQELLIIVDQFERLYTECFDGVQRDYFINLMLACASERVKILLVIRADYYGVLLEHPGLFAQAQKGVLNIPPMDPSELRLALEKPARAERCSLQPGLVERVTSDVLGRAADLPLLQFTLKELWEQDVASGVLTLASYNELGYTTPDGQVFPGVQGAIAKRAEQFWQKLSEAEQKSTRQIFLRLATASSVRADELSASSRRAWWSEFDTETQNIISQLVDMRLLTSGRELSNDQPVIEVAHEALLRAWPRLGRWLANYQPFVEWYEYDLSPFIRKWLDNQKSRDYLLPPAMLDEALTWSGKYPEELSGPAMEFIRESLQQRQRIRRRGQLGVAVIIAILSMAAIFSWFQADQARKSADIALSRQLAVQSIIFEDSRQDLALLLGVEAFGVYDTFEAKDALLRSIQNYPYVKTLLNSSAGEMTQIEFNSHKQLLAAATSNGDILLWNVANTNTPYIATTLSGSGSIDDIAFRDDGKLLAVVENNKLVIWDLTDITNPFKVSVSLGSNAIYTLTAVAIASNDNTIAVGIANSSENIALVQLWSLTDPKHPILLSETGPSLYPVELHFLPDGNTLLSKAQSDLELWDVSERKELKSLDSISLGTSFEYIGSVAVSAEMNLLVVGGCEHSMMMTSSCIHGQIQFWDISNSAKPAFLRTISDAHSDFVSNLAFSKDGNILVSSSNDGVVKLWDISEQSYTYVYGDPFVISPTPIKQIVSGTNASTFFFLASPNLIVGDISQAPVPVTLNGFPVSTENEIAAVDYDANRQILAAESYEESSGHLWDVSDLQHPVILEPDKNINLDAQFQYTPEGDLLKVRNWYPDSLTISLVSPSGEVTEGSVSFPESDQVIFGNFAINAVRNILATLSCTSNEWNSDSNNCAVSEVHLWDIQNVEKPIKIAKPFSKLSDENRIISIDTSGTILIDKSGLNEISFWDISNLSSPIFIGQFQLETQTISSFALSLNQHLLAVGSDRSILLYDIHDLGKPRKLGDHLYGLTGFVKQLIFDKDGERLISAGAFNPMMMFTPDLTAGKGTGIHRDLIVWDMDVNTWVRLACLRAGRNLTEDEWQQYLGDRPYNPVCAQNPEAPNEK